MTQTVGEFPSKIVGFIDADLVIHLKEHPAIAAWTTL